MKKAFGYTRVASTKVINRESSIASQEKAISDYCRKNRIKLLNTFSNIGKASAESICPALNRLFKSIQKTSVNYIVITELSRLSKDTIYLLLLKDYLKTVGIKILTVNQPDPYSKYLDELLTRFNAYYSEEIRAKKKTYVDCSCENA